MRILHISTFDSGGAGVCCLRLHQALLDSGLESKMVTLKKTKQVKGLYGYGYYRYAASRVISIILRKFGLVITESNKIFKLQKANNTYTIPISAVDLTKCKWVEWADIIHLHWVNTFMDYPSFLREINKPIVWTLHDENLFYGIAHHRKSILPNNLYEQKYKKIKYDAVRSAKDLTIVFLSQMMYDTFGNEKIIDGRRKVVINNSVNPDVYYAQSRDEMRKKYGVEEGKTVFAFVSLNIADPNKGLDALSKALRSIAPDAEILAVGGNPSGHKWYNVREMGAMNDPHAVCEVLSCANYYAMPSYQEGFSQSLLEALACGLPAVVFPVSGSLETINDRNGIICSDFSLDSLKSGIKALMKRPYDARGIRDNIIERFSPEVIAKKYIGLYQDILNK